MLKEWNFRVYEEILPKRIQRSPTTTMQIPEILVPYVTALLGLHDQLRHQQQTTVRQHHNSHETAITDAGYEYSRTGNPQRIIQEDRMARTQLHF